jgi:hypothetical protein
MRNVLDELPHDQHAQVVNVMRAAWKLTDFDEGMKRLEGLARFLEHDYESAARSLREGMAEMFTIQKLKLPPTLYTCLGTTNVIDHDARNFDGAECMTCSQAFSGAGASSPTGSFQPERSSEQIGSDGAIGAR